MRRWLGWSLLLAGLFMSAGAIAGDAAMFASLGWSVDSRHYAFAQYGYHDGSGFPYANVYVIDAASNRYATGGRIDTEFKDMDKSDTDALKHVLEKARAKFRALGLAQSVGVDAGVAPRCVQSADETSSTCALISPAHGNLTLRMKQKSVVGEDPTSDTTKASFSLALEGNSIRPMVLEDGKTQRVRVLDYKIDRIFFSPDGQHLAVIIQKREAAFEGPSLRYMADVGVMQKAE